MSKYILSDLFKGDFPITQRYNENPASYQMFIKPGHEGLDFGTPNGTEVLAPFDGIILRDTFNDKDYGNFTVIWDSVQHCAVWYCHLQDVATTTGDKVKKGMVVAHTNNTGHSTGPHLHCNFVETDASGNRLNMDNGKQGFLDILDPNLVEWKMNTQPQPLPPVPSDTSSPQSMKQIIIDVYRSLCGVEPSKDEIKARLESNINTYDLIRDINGRDERTELYKLAHSNPPMTPKTVSSTQDTPTAPKVPNFLDWLKSILGL